MKPSWMTTKLMVATLMSALLVTSLLSACVTINIYFPAAAAEKAADKIIDDVWQLNPNGQPNGSSETKPAEPPAK